MDDDEFRKAQEELAAQQAQLEQMDAFFKTTIAPRVGAYFKALMAEGVSMRAAGDMAIDYHRRWMEMVPWSKAGD